MNVKEIKEMLQLMAEHGLTEIEIEKDGMKIKLKKGGYFSEEAPSSPSVVVPMPSLERQSQIEAGHAPAAESANIFVVKSPMVGTFYSAPAPDQPVYAIPGKKLKEGDVLCIIEAMKLMNEIKSEIAGTVLEVLVKNGQPVEFDQPLFKIQRG